MYWLISLSVVRAGFSNLGSDQMFAVYYSTWQHLMKLCGLETKMIHLLQWVQTWIQWGCCGSSRLSLPKNMNQSWRSSEGRTIPNSLCRSDQQHQFSWVWVQLRFQHHCKCYKCLNKGKSLELFMCYYLEVSVRHGRCWTLCVGEWHRGACLRAGIAMVISYCWELFLIPSVLADSHHLSSSGSWQQHLADCTGVDWCGGWLTNDAAVLSLFDHYSRVLLWQRYENKQWDGMTGTAINECFHYWLIH